MSDKRGLKTQPVGRPPAGRGGERVKDYPQVSVRLPTDVRQKLRALVEIRRQPQWRLVVEAVECYLRTLPRRDRQLLRTMVGHDRSLRSRRARD